MKTKILLLGILSASFLHAQKQSYKDVDEFVKAFKAPIISEKNLATVTHQITDQWNADTLKARAIFDFVANYYDYDYDFLKEGFGKSTREGLGVCWQYSQLFGDMADVIGLETRMIFGWSKAGYKDINKINKKSYHAWNVIKINGQWRPVDCTWASGYMDKKTHDFVHVLDPSMFMTDKVVFSTTHHPDSGFQYIAYSTQSLESFYAAPLFHTKNFSKEFYFKPCGAKQLDFTDPKNPTVSFEYEGNIKEGSWTYSDVKEKEDYALKAEVKDGVIKFTFPEELNVDGYLNIRYMKKSLVTLLISYG